MTKYLEVKMEQMLVTLQGGNAQGILPGEDKSEPQGIKVPSASTFSDGSSSKLTGSNVGIEHPNAQQGTESAKNNGNSQLTGKYVGLEHPSTLQGTECTKEFRQSRTPHIMRGVKLSDIGAEGSLNFQMGKGGSLNFPAQFRTIYNKVCAQGSQSVVSLIRIMVILLDSQSSVTVEQHVTTKLVGKDDQQLNEELRKDFWSVLPEKEGSTYDPDVHDELVPKAEEFRLIFFRFARFVTHLLFTSELQKENKRSFQLYVHKARQQLLSDQHPSKIVRALLDMREISMAGTPQQQISMQDVFNAFGEIMTTASLVHREAFKTNVLQINKEWAQSDIVNGEPEQMSQRVFIERMNRFAVMVQQVFELPPMEQAVTQQSTISNVMHEIVQPVQVDESEHPIFSMVAENGAGNVFNVQADFAEWPSDFDYEEAAENFSSINAVTFERAAKFNKNIKCYNCGKMGHYRSECRTGTAQSAARHKMLQVRKNGALRKQV